MAVFNESSIPDLVAGTLRHLGRMKFQQIAQNLIRYEVFTKWFKKDRVIVTGGLGIQRNLMVKHQSSARHVGWNEQDRSVVPDVIKQLFVGWRYMTDNWAMDYRELLIQSGPTVVLDIIKPRRASCMLSIAEELERKAWSCPAKANEVDPYGIPYWIVKNSATGFYGALPSDHDRIGGLTQEQAPKFKNYSGTYAAVTKAELIKKWRKMHRQTNFVSPVTIDDYRGEMGRTYRHYVNEDTISDIEDVGEAQNENLGRDLGKMDGQMTFKSNPIIHVPLLDEDSQNPVYSIDHSTWYPIVLKGLNLVEGETQKVPGQHFKYYIPVDLGYNYICIDRRLNGVLYKA